MNVVYHSLVLSWLAKSPKNVVILQCAMFGYEHLYMGVLKRFKTKVQQCKLSS